MDALRFRTGTLDRISSLGPQDRLSFLEFCDRTQLTLAIGQRWGAQLPDWLRTEIDRRAAKNTERWTITKRIYSELAARLETLDFLVLKGFASCPEFAPAPEMRAQYDIDLLFSPAQVFAARDALEALGYEAMPGFERTPIDHLPAMIRKSGWEWRGDYFDPDIPTSIDLHFRLWDEQTEGFGLPGLDEFPGRAVNRRIEEISFRSLSRTDALSYAALHALRHLLRGSLRPSHAYEIAWFLERHSSDDDFAQTWRTRYDIALRSRIAVSFAMARCWFDCRLPAIIAEDVASLPAPVTRWFEVFGESPLRGLAAPNKDEIWLHLALLEGNGARFRILRRRLFPVGLPGQVDAVFVPDTQMTFERRILQIVRYAAFVASRILHHVRGALSFAVSRLWWKTALGPNYWRYFLTAALFDVGLFIFFLLYNIYLLDLGFDERFLGIVSSSMMIGSIAGSLLAPFALARWGGRKSLRVCLAILALVSALRAAVIVPAALLALAALSGAGTAMWAVALSPTVAHLTEERSRSVGFSLIIAAGIALGVFAGMLGGGLPGLLGSVGLARTPALRVSLLGSCVILLAGTISLRKLGDIPVPREPLKSLKPDPALLRFLLAIAVWHLGTGLFNPFFNAYFVRLELPVSRIGLLFSASQAAQTAAVLAAPLLLQRFGLVRGVAAMQAATALALFLLAGMPGAAGASLAYPVYMAFQYMSEPGMFSYLMNSASPSHRGTASALNFVVAFGSQAVASALAGAIIASSGYSPVLLSAAILCAVAALLFRMLRPGASPLRTSSQ